MIGDVDQVKANRAAARLIRELRDRITHLERNLTEVTLDRDRGLSRLLRSEERERFLRRERDGRAQVIEDLSRTVTHLQAKTQADENQLRELRLQLALLTTGPVPISATPSTGVDPQRPTISAAPEPARRQPSTDPVPAAPVEGADTMQDADDTEQRFAMLELYDTPE